MKQQLVYYLDNCVYSKMLEPDFDWLLNSFLAGDNRVAFSDVHLEEMQDNCANYARLLQRLDALFIRNPGVLHGEYHHICSLDECDIERRFIEHADFRTANQALYAMLAPMQHLLGGQKDATISDIAEGTASEVSDLLSQLVGDHVDKISRSAVREKIKAALAGSSEKLTSIDAEKSRLIVETQFQATRHGDPMRDMDPTEKVAHLFSTLDEESRDEIEEKYPLHFATKRPLASGELTVFSFLLFTLGLTKRKGKFSGTRQLQKFAAEFKDAMHIEEASRCDFFFTFDEDASRLAASALSYAGFPTQVVHLARR
ncbi:hypothetical protein SM764_01030 [Pseudophaeobacter sp. 1A16562]|uniref:hypothetical protein n=1 Tax=Pseudophaeobacter sp. 1A16562 TaxID=3098143 RepID=UPI0034D4BC0E